MLKIIFTTVVSFLFLTISTCWVPWFIPDMKYVYSFYNFTLIYCFIVGIHDLKVVWRFQNFRIFMLMIEFNTLSSPKIWQGNWNHKDTYYSILFSVNLNYEFLHIYRNSQKHKSTLLHTYVLNEFLTAERSCKTKYLWKNSYRSWYLTSLRFFWHLLRLNWSIIRGTVSLWILYENGKIAVFEGKWRRFRILPKV